jgi:phospholipase D1/2
VAVALLNAQKEILITCWKNSPCVLLTRPPLPSIRLDHILKYKAEQGVKIFILLYKEVEYVGQGNDSGAARHYLTSLHKNIRCIRHPNKFIGGSTAVLWSHHEKTVVVDR